MASKNRVTDGIVVVGAKAHPLRDLYHLLLTVRWWGAIGAIGIGFLVINALFATGFVITGGIEGGQGHGSFADAFFFSAQTLGTIGYGAMHPVSLAANLLVVVESIVGILFAAVSTGIVFARFSRSTESVIFSDHPCIGPIDGKPTLSLRIGNDREGAVMDAQIRIAVAHTHRTLEGVTMYRMRDLVLVRDRTPMLGRTWTVMHEIDAGSPLFEATPASCEKQELELIVTVVGTDDTSLQPVHGRRRYLASEIRWSARLADVLSELADGRLQLDVRRFHDVVPSEPIGTEQTTSLPYPPSMTTDRGGDDAKARADSRVKTRS
jgi:inward rectifier potassium channel